jgi:hypothetical protein
MDCVFELNGKALSVITCAGMEFPAFSGLGQYRNKRAFHCRQGGGPLPIGIYYIVNRPSGGVLGPLRDLWNSRGDWLALYAADNKIDDETFCNAVRRGQFRIHPKGPLGISEGCITLEKTADFQKLRAFLMSATPVAIPESSLKAYGRVIVR